MKNDDTKLLGLVTTIRQTHRMKENDRDKNELCFRRLCLLCLDRDADFGIYPPSTASLVWALILVTCSINAAGGT